MAKFLLLGLCEPQSEADQAAFDEWFVEQHIEDTTHCPNFVRGRVYKLAGPHLDLDCPSKFLAIYEVEAPTYESMLRGQEDVARERNPKHGDIESLWNMGDTWTVEDDAAE